MAQQVGDPDLLLEAHHALWAILFYGGEAAAARPHLEQGLRLYNPERHRSHAGSYGGHDPGVCCRMVTASSLWLLGYPDQAVVSSQSSLELAQQLDHPFSLTIALVFAAMLHHCRREAPLTQARTETAITLAVEQNFPQQLERARSLRGWALAACGHVEEGIAQIHQGLASAQSIGATRDQSALLAEAYAAVGQITEGLEASAEALDVLGKSGVRWWEAGIRLKGELLLQRSEAPQDEIESCLIKRSPWPEPSRRSLSNYAQPESEPTVGATGKTRVKHDNCLRQSTAGSLRASTQLICRPRKHFKELSAASPWNSTCARASPTATSASASSTGARVVCSPIELDTDGAILRREGPMGAEKCSIRSSSGQRSSGF